MAETEFKAAIFDAVGTLVQKDLTLGRYIPRSEALIPILRSLNEAGVPLYLVSTIASRVVDETTFPGVKFEVEIPFDQPDGRSGKPDAFAAVLVKLARDCIMPNQVVAFGDDSTDEGKAAAANKIRFVQVAQFFRTPPPEAIAELENELRSAFPTVFAKKPGVLKLDTAPVEKKRVFQPHLPLEPRCPRRLRH